MASPHHSAVEQALPDPEQASERQQVQPGALPSTTHAATDEGPQESSDSSDPLLPANWEVRAKLQVGRDHYLIRAQM